MASNDLRVDLPELARSASEVSGRQSSVTAVSVSTPIAGASFRRSEHPFLADLQDMMHGFGDSYPSDPESMLLMEKLVLDYIHTLCNGCCKVAEMTGRLDKEGLLFLIKKDRKKFERVCSLLRTNDVLKRHNKLEFSTEPDEAEDEDEDDEGPQPGEQQQQVQVQVQAAQG